MLLHNDTFEKATQYRGEPVVPCKAVHKTKLRSDGMIDKLKVRIAICGNFDHGARDEDNWAPLASFRLIKIFLAEAARRKRRIYQADFVGAYLQGYMDRLVYVMLPSEWAELFPEYAEWFGTPLVLRKSAYGINSAGRLWAEELFAWYTAYGFVQSENDPALFIYRKGDDWVILLSYVDDSAYFCSSDSMRKKFETAMSEAFAVTLLGQLHWFLQARITQNSMFDVTLDQSRYAAATIAKFLPGSEVVNPSDADKRRYGAPLPSNFVFTVEDRSENEEAVKALEREYGMEYRSVIGSLLWLMNTFTRLQFAIRKLAKFNHLPGRKHFVAMIHCLHHIRCFHRNGVTYYSKVDDAPVTRMLHDADIEFDSPFFGMSDSSWQDCPDTGRSTGGFLTFYQGGITDASSNVPDPVAMSSAEAEYNAASVAGMDIVHLRALILEIREEDPDTKLVVPLLIDNQSAIAMGNSFRNGKHTRHVMRRFHYVRSLVKDKVLKLIWIPGDPTQLSDVMTKNLLATATTYLLFCAVCETLVKL